MLATETGGGHVENPEAVRLADAFSMVTGSLKELPDISLELVSGHELEPLWDDLVDSHHYLGCKKLLGKRLKYMAFLGHCPVAALSWSAPAKRLKVRDDFIGWTDETRHNCLQCLAANSRFVIFPWVRIPHLASHLMGRNLRRLKSDWHQAFQVSLLMVESFVDPKRFRGTVYKASNWLHLGATKGYTKIGKGYVYHGRLKEVFIYVLEPRFRDILGVPSTSDVKRALPKQVEELSMILHNLAWDPHPLTQLSIDENDLQDMAKELADFHHEFHSCFARNEQERLGYGYLAGLLSNLTAKSAEPMALHIFGDKSVRSLQRFMKTYRWDHEAMLQRLQTMAVHHLGSPEGMITVDPSEFPKKGNKSVGVTRQYCGRLGKVDNCQSGVFLGYTSQKGYGLIDCRLYMPEKWFSEEYKELRKENLVPEDLCFQTKQDIALQMIAKAAERFPARWVGCDAAFGSDDRFLASLPQGLYYFADVKSSEKVFLEKPEIGIPEYQGRGRPPSKKRVVSAHRSYTVSELADSKELNWITVNLGEGAKGPLLAHVACLRVYPSRAGLPAEDPVWLIIRKRTDGQIRYAFSNAPETITFQELCQASCQRWPIEQCFEEGKSHLGMDHYEHRSWPAWHRHMLYVMLAQHFLFRIRARFKKNSRHDPSADQKNARNRLASASTDQGSSHGTSGVYHQTQSHSLSLSQKETSQRGHEFRL